MKRARSSSVDSDAASSASAATSSVGLERSPPSSSSSAYEEFEEPAASPLLSLLVPVLALLREGEVFADALRRLAAEKSGGLDELTGLHRTAMTQHELVLMSMTREAILLRAVAESRRTGEALPHVWVLRWLAKPAVVHGPFSEAAMEQWHRDGFFGKKPAEVRDLNSVSPAWVPALSLFSAPPP